MNVCPLKSRQGIAHHRDHAILVFGADHRARYATERVNLWAEKVRFDRVDASVACFNDLELPARNGLTVDSVFSPEFASAAETLQSLLRDVPRHKEGVTT